MIRKIHREVQRRGNKRNRLFRHGKACRLLRIYRKRRRYGGKKIKYSISNEEYISFFDDSSFATINGEKVDFGDEYVAYVDGVKCKVPFDFINNAIEGIRMKLDARNNRIEVTRLHSPANKKQYAVIAFTTKNFEVVQALANVKGQKYVYNIDVNEYLKYIDPDDKGKYAFLVNRAMPLGKNYVPEDLVYLKDLGIAIGNQSRIITDSTELPLWRLRQCFVDGKRRSKGRLCLAPPYLREQGRLSTIMLRIKKGKAKRRNDGNALFRAGTSNQTGLCVDILQGNYGLTKD